MKRFKRMTAIILSLVLFAGVTALAGARQDDRRIPENVQDFAQMCD